jgi:hypothetical protein
MHWCWKITWLCAGSLPGPKVNDAIEGLGRQECKFPIEEIAHHFLRETSKTRHVWNRRLAFEKQRKKHDPYDA